MGEKANHTMAESPVLYKSFNTLWSAGRSLSETFGSSAKFPVCLRKIRGQYLLAFAESASIFGSLLYDCIAQFAIPFITGRVGKDNE